MRGRESSLARHPHRVGRVADRHRPRRYSRHVAVRRCRQARRRTRSSTRGRSPHGVERGTATEASGASDRHRAPRECRHIRSEMAYAKPFASPISSTCGIGRSGDECTATCGPLEVPGLFANGRRMASSCGRSRRKTAPLPGQRRAHASPNRSQELAAGEIDGGPFHLVSAWRAPPLVRVVPSRTTLRSRRLGRDLEALVVGDELERLLE